MFFGLLIVTVLLLRCDAVNANVHWENNIGSELGFYFIQFDVNLKTNLT